MSKIKVKLNVFSESEHISQIITGFIMLVKSGVVDLKINFCLEVAEKYPFNSMVEAIINDEIKVAYDMLDGYNFDCGLVNEYISSVDYYFKRSYNYDCNKDLKFSSRIYPLGLNYHVTIRGNPIDNVNLQVNYKNPQKLVKNLIKKMVGYNNNFFYEQFEDKPQKNKKNKILFTTRTWSPYGEKGEDPNWFSDEEKSSRVQITHMRAKCIELLKEEFGNGFVGGFTPSEYAVKHFPNLVVDRQLTNRINFMDLVKKSDICIATTGLHNSIGWKLGEYVAASKAIVSERLNYLLPGNFKEKTNYLEFSDAYQCIEQTSLLANNSNLIYAMKQNNYEYYQNFVRPDMLVLNSLNQVLNKTEENISKPFGCSAINQAKEKL